MWSSRTNNLIGVHKSRNTVILFLVTVPTTISSDEGDLKVLTISSDLSYVCVSVEKLNSIARNTPNSSANQI